MALSDARTAGPDRRCESSKDLAKKYWAEAFATTVLVCNVSPPQKQSETPHELFFGSKPNVEHPWTSGCVI
jgi:hypothetical protein